MIIPRKLSFWILILLISLFPSSSESLQGYNEPCELYDETSSCDDSIGLMCIHSMPKGYRCKCPSGDNQFSTLYDSKRNRCVGKVFNTCVRPSGLHRPSTNVHNNRADTDISNGAGTSNNNINGTLFYCVENAECNSSIYYLPICVCQKGFFETDEGMCSPVAKYGQPCDNDKAQCDAKYGLTCLPDGKCGCKDTPNQFYDPQEEKCITYVGGNCSVEESLCVPHAVCREEAPYHPNAKNQPKRTIIFGSSSSEEVNKNAENSLSLAGIRVPKPIHHQPNLLGGILPSRPRPSFPSSNHGNMGAINTICMCVPGYSPTQNGSCMRSYGAVCKSLEKNATEICNPDQFLECLDGHDGHFRCQCRNPLSERWDSEKQKCVSVIGRNCRSSSSYPECEAGAECFGGICLCKKGASQTSSGVCKLDYNERCLPGECNVERGLTCHGKTASCLCIDSFLKYDPKKKACVAGVGSPCGNPGISKVWPNPTFRAVRGQFDRFPSNEDDVTSSLFIDCEEGSTCKPQLPAKRFACVADSKA
jgi:hypothetical protein